MPRKRLEKPATCRMVPLKDAAKQLGRSVRTLRDWYNEGYIGSNLVRGRILIPESEIERIAAETYRPRVAN